MEPHVDPGELADAIADALVATDAMERAEELRDMDRLVRRFEAARQRA